MKKKHRTIILPFLLTVIPVIAGTLILLIVLFNGVIKNQVYQLKTELGLTVTSDIGKSFETWIEDQILLGETLANEPSVITVCENFTDEKSYEHVLRHFKTIKNRYDYFENIFVIMYHDKEQAVPMYMDGEVFRINNGDIFLSAAGSYVIGKAGDKNYSEAVRDGKDYFISNVAISMESRTPVFIITVPVKNEDGLLGAIGISLKMNYFIEKFGVQEYFGENEYLFVADEEGNIIAHRDSDLVLSEKGQNTMIPFMKHIENNDMMFEMNYLGNKNLYISQKMESFENNRANEWYFFYRDSYNDMFASLEGIKQQSALYVIIALLIVGTIIFIVSRTIIVKPLKKLGDELDQISRGGGDLTTSVKIKTMNEIGIIGDSFNTFSASLREMIKRIKGSVNINTDIGQRLIVSSDETSSAVSEILSNIASIKSIIKNLVEQSDNAGKSTVETADGLEKLTGQAENQSAAVEQSTAAVEQMISSLKSMAGSTERNKETTDVLVKTAETSSSMLDDTYDSIQQVTKNIDSILEMVEVIDNISSQTNLLAMNAAIEAAHAGESGKGFAVVADEIRKLAEDAGNSSGQIEAEVKRIIEQINHSSDYSKKLQTIIRKMLSDIKGLAMAFSEINSSSIELSAGSDQVLKAMSSLNELSIDLSEAAEKMKAGTNNVSKNISSVLDLTRTTNSAIEEISYGSNEIISAMTEVQGHSAELETNTKKLSDEVESFKTD